MKNWCRESFTAGACTMLVFERILNWVVVGGCRLEWFRGLNTFPLGMAIIVLLMLASRQRDANPEKKETE